jgi:MFS family permease
MAGDWVKRNIAALYVVKIAKWLNLVMPIVVLFYNSNGMSMQDIFTLKAIYSFTLMFFEIPTGYFADLVGRKKSILTGSILGAAGYLIYSFSSGFNQFVIAEVALGISLSLVSGADSAMLFDTLRAGGKVSKYLRLEGKITSTGNFAEAIAGIIGGLLAVISLRTPFFFQAAIASIAIPAAIALREPPLSSTVMQTGIRELARVIRVSVFHDKKLSWAIMLSAIIGVSTLTMAWFTQPFFILADLKTGWFGIAWAILNAAVGIAAYYAWRFEEKAGSKTTVILIAVMLASAYIFISFMPVVAGFAVLLIYYVFRGLATPTLRNFINQLTDSGVRATVLSVRNFIIRLLFTIFGPLFGWFSDAYSLKTALLAAGLIFGLLSGIATFFFIRHSAFESNMNETVNQTKLH